MLNEKNFQIELILKEYFKDAALDNFNIEKIPFGICNETYKISYKKRYFILQKLNNIIANANLIKDFDFVTRKLARLGWNVPLLLKNNKDLNFIEKNKNIWRMYPFIPDRMLSELKKVDYFSVGELLAKFHKDLKKIDYSPCFSISHFHDTNFFVSCLKEVTKHLEDTKLVDISKKIIGIYGSIKNISSKSIQLIHGDSRIENYLFDNKGKALSIIDFDTLMFGSIFIDIGDLLRSINLTENQTVLRFSKKSIKDIISGYLSINQNVEKIIFIDNVLNGMKQITLELCSRFLIDIVKDNYFGWDQSRYKSRKENNIARALAQWNLFKEIEKINLDNLV